MNETTKIEVSGQNAAQLAERLATEYPEAIVEVGTEHVSGVRFDPLRRVATIKGKEISLTGREFGLLKYLVETPGVVTRKDLLCLAFGAHPDTFTNVIDVYITYLRRKLGCYSGMIETVRGQGYRFVEAVD